MIVAEESRDAEARREEPRRKREGKATRRFGVLSDLGPAVLRPGQVETSGGCG